MVRNDSIYISLFSVPPIFARVQIKVTRDASVYVGGNITLACEYTGVSDPSAIGLQWEHRPSGQQAGSGIWLYDGRRNTNRPSGSQDKFEKVDTDIAREHAIQLKVATLSDEGTYICVLEIYNDGGFTEYRDDMFLTILGM